MSGHTLSNRKAETNEGGQCNKSAVKEKAVDSINSAWLLQQITTVIGWIEDHPLVTTVIGGIILAIILGFSRILSGAVARLRLIGDRRKVRRWLTQNTKDEPGESHATVSRISEGVGLYEERVARACFASKHILRSERSPDNWSVWRKEPQSIYEKRGLISLGGEQQWDEE